MKCFHSFLIAALATSMLCGTTRADDPWDGIGKGRLLRKIRDDLFGSPDQQKPVNPAPNDPRQQPTPAQPQSAQQQAARNPNYGRPAVPPNQQQHQYAAQPALAQQQAQQQQQAARPYGAPPQASRYQLLQQQQQQTQPQDSSRNVTSYNQRSYQNQRPAAAPQIEPPAQFANHSNAARTANPNLNPALVGFGMEIEIGKDENLYVANVERNGNADKAGVRRGDMIVLAGGAKLASLVELSEITKVLGAGDQLEFQVSRRGQTKDLMIQYGEAQPLPPATEPVNSNNANPIELELGAADLSSPRLKAPAQIEHVASNRAVTGRYEFVPQASANGYASVLELDGSARQTTAAPQYRTDNRNRSGVETKLTDAPNRLISHLQSGHDRTRMESAQAHQEDSLNETQFGVSILEVK